MEDKKKTKAQLIAELEELRKHENTTGVKSNKLIDDEEILINNIQAAIIIHDSNAKVISCNDEAEKVLGVTRSQMLGTETVNTEWEFIDEDGNILPVEKYPVYQVLSTKQPVVNLVYSIHKKNNEIQWVYVSANPIFDSEGEIFRIVVTFMDITKRKKAEEALKGKIVELNSFINNIPDMAWVMDIESRFIATNTAYGKAVGKNPNELINKGYEVCFGKKGSKKLREDDMKVIKNRKQIIIEEKINIGNNSIWLETIKSPIFDNSEKVVGTVGIARNITYRKQAEEALSQQREELNIILDTVPAMIFYKDKEDRFIRVNENLAKTFNMSKVYIVGKKASELSSTPEKDYWEDDKQVIESGLPKRNIIEPVETQEGKVWFQTDKIPYKDKKGNIIGIIGFSIDITEHKKAEEALKESEQRYRDIFNNAAVSIWEEDFSEVKKIIDELKAQGVTDIKTYLNDHPEIVKEAYLTPKKLDVNDMTLKLYGARTKEELLVPYGKHMTPKTFEWFHKFMISIAEEKEYFESETVNQTIDGRMIDVRIRINIPNEAEQFKSLLLTVTDITERKKAEEALKESEEKYRTLTEGLRDVVVSFSLDGRIDYCSPVVKEFGGYNPEEEVGNHLSKYIADEAELQKLQGLFQQIIDTQKPVTFEFLYKPKNKKPFYVETTANPIIRGNKVETIQCVVRDITERKQLEEERMKTEKLESIGILAGGIAHDFNNILAVILGNVSLAKINLDNKSEVVELLTETENASVRATKLTQQLLTFAKGGAPVKEITELTALIRETTQFSLRGSNVQCRTSISPDLWAAEVDKGQISQAVGNLVINAKQAMPEGGTINIKAKNVTVTPEDNLPLREGNYIKISLEDKGHGIPKKQLTKIFDPFITTKQKGSGLGLTITYSIIHRHDGHITVESEIGVGSTFHIYLPASVERVEGEKAVKEDTAVLTGKILVMDDEEMVRNVVLKALKSFGIDVDEASNGAEAIEKYKKAMDSGNPFDVVIMDLTIPGGMGGKKTIKKLLEIDPDAKAVVSSGYANDPVISNFEAYGFSGFIPKPYKLDELKKVLDKVL